MKTNRIPKNFPADWDNSPIPNGVTKNVAARCYNVRISVAGKQLHVATSSHQSIAANLYDLALWKLCPKMTKHLEPNYPEYFSLVTQRSVESNCPRLNKLYARLPFVREGDRNLDEDTLRELVLAGRNQPEQTDSQMHDYDKTIEFLRRAVVELADIEVKLANRTSKITKLNKLAEAPIIHSDLRSFLGQVRRHTERFGLSLERQRIYYQKLIDTQS